MVLEPTEEQVNTTVDQVLQTSLEDAHAHGGVCPLCGHSKEIAYSNRPSVLFVLLVACLVVGAVLSAYLGTMKLTKRNAAVNVSVARLNGNAAVVGLLGKPIKAQFGVQGQVRQDETGWQEARLTIPVHGPQGVGVVRVAAGRLDGPWTFTTFEVIVEKQHKKVDLIAGRVVEYDPSAYVDVHLLPAVPPDSLHVSASAPHLDTTYPCVFGEAGNAGVTSQLGSCAMAPIAKGAVDRFEADLRFGRFVMRETDLALNDEFEVPLTRTYSSQDWVNRNHVHAFGTNANHPYDIAPVGSRNPYTFQLLALEDGDFLYFDRVSSGSGYEDAVYQHSESSTRFYKATQQWNGNGWTTKLADGAEIHFPESYNAINMAQGAPTEMVNPQGERLELIRDSRRNLQEIKTPHGHWIRFQYDGQARIIYAADDAGNWAKYQYDPEGMLTTVVLSTGRERHYQYVGKLMTAISDERGKVLLRNTFGYGELTRQEFADGSIYLYRYDRSASRTYVEQAHVTLPNGQTQDIPISNEVSSYLKQNK